MNILISGRAEVSEVGEPTPLIYDSMEVHDVDIVALSTNSGLVWIGCHNVRATVGNETGVPLEAEQSYHLDAVDLSTIYIDAVNVGDGVTWNAVNAVQ